MNKNNGNDDDDDDITYGKSNWYNINNELRKTKSEYLLETECKNENLYLSRNSLKSTAITPTTTTTTTATCKPYRNWYKPKPLQLPTKTIADDTQTQTNNLILTNTISSKETLKMDNVVDEGVTVLSTQKKQIIKNEFNNNSAISFDEESLIFNNNTDSFNLTDSNNFPQIIQQDSFQDVKKQQQQLLLEQDNSLNNFCTFTNSSILTYEQAQEQLQQQNPLEIYDNLLLIQQQLLKQKQQEKNITETVKTTKDTILSFNPDTQPREYDDCQMDMLNDDDECNDDDDEFFLISSHGSNRKNIDDDEDDDDCDEEDGDEYEENIIEQEPFYFINANNQQIQIHTQQQLNRLSNIMEEDDDDIVEDDEQVAPTTTTTTVNYKSTMRKRTYNLNTYLNTYSNDDMLDKLIDKLNNEQKAKFENKNRLNEDESNELYESLREFNENDEDEVEEDDGHFEEKGTGYTVFYPTDSQGNEEAQKAPLCNQDELDEGNEDDDDDEDITNEPQSIPITALKIEPQNDNENSFETTTGSDVTDDESESDGTSDTNSTNNEDDGDVVEEEIILIGEKNDIKNLLSNNNNQLTNFFMQNEIKQQTDKHYKHIAKYFVKNVIDMAVSNINETVISENKDEVGVEVEDTQENILDYYENLEKNLMKVRNEIDKLKNDAYMDLEYITSILQNNNQNSILSTTEEDEDEEDEDLNKYLTPLQSYLATNEADLNGDEEEEDDDTARIEDIYNENTTTTATIQAKYYSALEEGEDVSVMEDEEEVEEVVEEHDVDDVVDHQLIQDNKEQEVELVVHESPKPQIRTFKGSLNLNEFLTTPLSLPPIPQMSNNYYKSLHNLTHDDDQNRAINATATTPKQSCKVEKNVLDKCLKIASYNVSLFNLHDTSNNTVNQQQQQQQQQPQQTHSMGRTVTEKGVFSLIDEQKKVISSDNEFRIPSSRHFCGRLLSTNLMGAQQQTPQQSHQSQQQQQPQQQQKIKAKSSYNLENIENLLNNHQEPSLHRHNDESKQDTKASVQSLSKSIKDLRLFVSNSYSPSLIIRPPSPTVPPKTSTSTLNYQTLPTNRPTPTNRTVVKHNSDVLPRHNISSAYLNGNNKRQLYNENQQQQQQQSRHQRQSAPLARNDDDVLLNCILDMKPPVPPPPPPINYNKQQPQQPQRQSYTSNNNNNNNKTNTKLSASTSFTLNTITKSNPINVNKSQSFNNYNQRIQQHQEFQRKRIKVETDL